MTGTYTAVLPWSGQECCVGFWNALLERKMETIRKKIDVLKHTLNDVEDRAAAAEKELEKSAQRNSAVTAHPKFLC